MSYWAALINSLYFFVLAIIFFQISKLRKWTVKKIDRSSFLLQIKEAIILRESTHKRIQSNGTFTGILELILLWVVPRLTSAWFLVAYLLQCIY